MERVTFEQKVEFAASNAAEAWCAERGISVDIIERGLLYRDFEVAPARTATGGAA